MKIKGAPSSSCAFLLLFLLTLISSAEDGLENRFCSPESGQLATFAEIKMLADGQ
ncbi:hypothetical protein SETIT_8G208500v2 [Setaria italica]|uniref:Uncharacterized protein n=1 Tax=Setaria italica TaxID=4555 RepID=A0A368S9Y8_SETIT|nr:hypothetical protein SETIT_8G208500v2 [Setaria italica]